MPEEIRQGLSLGEQKPHACNITQCHPAGEMACQEKMAQSFCSCPAFGGGLFFCAGEMISCDLFESNDLSGAPDSKVGVWPGALGSL